MNWKRRRQNADDRMRREFLDPLPRPEDEPEKEVFVEADVPQPATESEKQEPAVSKPNKPWFPPFLDERRKAAVDRSDRALLRRIRGRLTGYLSPIGD
jgi:hypothetical protein